MPLLTFLLSQNTYTLTPNAQIWPRTLNGIIGGSSNYLYLVVKDSGRNAGVPGHSNFILGYVFLERFYTVYDTTNRRIGIAATPWTAGSTN